MSGVDKLRELDDRLTKQMLQLCDDLLSNDLDSKIQQIQIKIEELNGKLPQNSIGQFLDIYTTFSDQQEEQYAVQDKLSLRIDDKTKRVFAALSESFFKTKLNVSLTEKDTLQELPAGMDLQNPRDEDRLLLAAGALLHQTKNEALSVFSGTPFEAAGVEINGELFPMIHQCLKTSAGAFVELQSNLRVFSCSHAFPHPKTQDYKNLPGLTAEKIGNQCPICKKFGFQDFLRQTTGKGGWTADMPKRPVSNKPKVPQFVENALNEQQVVQNARAGQILRENRLRAGRPDFVVPRPDLDDDINDFEVPVLMNRAANGNLAVLGQIQPQWDENRANDARFLQEQLAHGNLNQAQRNAFQRELRRIQEEVVNDNLQEMGFQFGGPPGRDVRGPGRRGGRDAWIDGDPNGFGLGGRPLPPDPNQQAFPMNPEQFRQRHLGGRGAGRGLAGFMGFH